MLWNALQREYVLDAKYSHWNVLNLATNYKYRVTLLYAENMYCTLLNIYNNFPRNHYKPKQGSAVSMWITSDSLLFTSSVNTVCIKQENRVGNCIPIKVSPQESEGSYELLEVVPSNTNV